jgi:hypothetical protein
MKKIIIIILLSFLIISCKSVEERIKDYSYTNEWYYLDTIRYQVYKTKSGEKYIIVLNKKNTRFKRKYIN